MLGMLPKVVELREAHWFWLHDLTSADPYHILPIVMVVSQFLVQFYMPAPGVDPQQQKMMAFMMPAFSQAMRSTWLPRKSWWSSEIDVIAQAAGCGITLVASYRPPRPTSTTQRSAGVRANSR